MKHLVLAGLGVTTVVVTAGLIPGRHLGGAVQAPAAAPPVKVTADVDYVPTAEYGGRKDRLDVYAPAGAKNAPVVVSIHGGALRNGDKARQTYVGERFAAAGFVTMVINYRLSPGVMHPAHVEDAAHAVAWARTHAAGYGGDPRQLFVIGHSAGAYLAALLALDPRYLGAYQMAPTDLRGVVPVSAFFYVDRPGVAPDRPKDVWGTDVAIWQAASPAAYLRKEVPPMLLLYADGDDAWRRQQNTDFLDGLKKAGAKDVEARVIAGRDHDSVWTRLKNPADQTADAIVAFVKARQGS